MSFRKAVPLMLAIFSGCGPSGGDGASPHAVLRYEPAVVELQGTIDTIWRFGPPNFGESPETDQREIVSVLKLAAPIDVLGDSASDLNQETARGLTLVQLVAPNDALWATLMGTKARVTGSLFHAQTGHHFTDVLITVQGVTPDSSR